MKENENDLCGIDKLHRPMCYWFKKHIDRNGVTGWILTVFYRERKEVFSKEWSGTIRKQFNP